MLFSLAAKKNAKKKRKHHQIYHLSLDNSYVLTQNIGTLQH